MEAPTAGISFMAKVEALAKAPIKPNLIPVFSKNSSLYNFLISIKLVMSTSLKVVKEALVFCDSLRRSAILKRILFILTLSSFLEKLVKVASSPDLEVSFLASFLGSSFFGFGASSFFGAALSSFFGSSLDSSFFGSSLAPPAGPSPSSIFTKSWPTVTVSSTSTKRSVIVPLTGAFTSTSILSVSMVAIVSSWLTKSPTSLRYSDKVPSVIDSAISGTLTV
mmetsp:Transcript_8836/g.11031  ORF Transcript_8836/g.11031 Transcript_8836/m.11031 type:complete len:222 (+) Transcript_8836:613-1278(+)